VSLHVGLERIAMAKKIFTIKVKFAKSYQTLQKVVGVKVKFNLFAFSL
jgi:hypothetical protein